MTKKKTILDFAEDKTENRPEVEVKYSVAVKTADKLGAGTDNGVRIRIDNDTSLEFKLDQKNLVKRGYLFEQNQRNIFDIYIKNLWSFERVIITLEYGQSYYHEWDLDYVEIIRLTTSHKFSCKCELTNNYPSRTLKNPTTSYTTHYELITKNGEGI